MNQKNISINPQIYESIVDEIAEEGSLCILDNSITDYLYNSIGTESGHKLSELYCNLCDLSSRHNKHICNELPMALKTIKESLGYIDDELAKNMSIGK